MFSYDQIISNNGSALDIVRTDERKVCHRQSPSVVRHNAEVVAVAAVVVVAAVAAVVAAVVAGRCEA